MNGKAIQQERGARRREEILAFIRRYTEQVGYGPTIREIATEVGLSSSGTVWTHLRKLQQAGALSYHPDRPHPWVLSEAASGSRVAELERRLALADALADAVEADAGSVHPMAWLRLLEYRAAAPVAGEVAA